MNIHGLDPVLQWNQPFDLRAATPTGQGYAGILLKSSLSPCSLCQGSFALSIGGQDLGQAPAGQCTWYIMRQPSAEQDGSTSILKIENLSQSRIISARDFLWQLPKATRLGSSIRGQGCLRLLRNGQRRAIPCKQVLASSLSASLSLSQLQPFRILPISIELQLFAKTVGPPLLHWNLPQTASTCFQASHKPWNKGYEVKITHQWHHSSDWMNPKRCRDFLSVQAF